MASPVFLPVSVLASAVFLLTWSTEVRAGDPQLAVTRDPSGGFSVSVDGKPFATYVVDQSNKPYFWPIYGPTGKAITRAFPMQEVAGEQRDHVHHRGITFGHDSMGLEGWTPAGKGEAGGEPEKAKGGGDSWSEAKSYEATLKIEKTREASQQRIAGLVRVVHKEYRTWTQEPRRVVVEEVCDYLDARGNRFLTEKRRFTFLAAVDWRAIDFDQELEATEGAVRLDDRKDSGLGIRIPSSMAVDSKQGGKILNSEGLQDAEAWGKAARWCDYSGPVEGETLGVAMMSHPSTYRFPDRWHVRTYGLFAVNPFGAKVFDKALTNEEPTTIPAGGNLKLRHRFWFHKGDALQAGVQDVYENYAKESR